MAGVSQFGTSKSGASVPRILVADDNSNIQKMVALAFQDHGIEVIAVGNGEAAVRKMPDLNPDVVLADVFMPVRNGYEVCEFIKKDPRFSKIPVILLVGAFDPLDEAEARRVGADGILKKPFVPPDPLIAMVTSVMAKAPKPEPKAEVPVLEIPKPPPPPPVAFPQFPDPTPEEEAYAFGTGRRSLDDDEGAAGAGQTAHVAVTSAAEFSMGPLASAEEEAGASETSVDWRRRDEVNSAEVPSFSAALMDEPAAQTAPESNAAIEPLAAVTVPDSPILTEEPNAEPPSSESFMRAFAGAFDDPPPVQAQVEVEEPAAPASPAWLKPLEDSLQSDKALTDLMTPALANPELTSPALVNPVPADRGGWNVSERAETPVETAVPATEESALPEVQAASPASDPAASRAAREFFAHEVAPLGSPAVEMPEPESFAFEPAAAEAAPRSTLDAIHFPPETVALGAPPPQASEVGSVEPAIAWAGAFGTAQPAPSETAPTGAAGFETAGIEAVETPAAEFESVARVEETEEIEPLASPVAILESAGIAPREIGRMATVETSVVASNVAPEVQSVAAPAAIATEPEPAPFAPAAEVEVAPPPAKPITEPAAAPQISAIFAQPDSQMLPVEAVPEPAASSAAQAETAVAPAQPAPSVDEVVARVLEKLGPQLQELLSKNLVRPLVEDLMHKTDEKK
jgi:CheY-like chemotaxis protein